MNIHKICTAWLVITAWTISVASGNETVHEWPMNRCNPGLTGRSPDTSVKPPLRLRWAYQLPTCASRMEPCVADGKVFLDSVEGPIMALDADTGTLVWKRMDLASRSFHMSTFCYDGQRLFVGMGSIGIHALDPDTGKTLWTHAFKGPAPLMVFAEGKVFFTRKDIRGVFAVAIRPGDGSEVWSKKIDAGPELWGKKRQGEPGWNIARQLCYADGLVYASASKGPHTSHAGRKATEGRVVALKAEDGKVVWQWDGCPSGGYEHSKFLTCVSDGRIVCCSASYKRKASVLDAKTGELLWTTGKGRHTSWFAIPDKHILGGCSGIGYRAVHDRKTGKYLGGPGGPRGASNCSLPAISGNYIYLNLGTPGVDSFITGYGRYPISSLGALDINTRKLVWSYRLEGNACASPAIAYGRVYESGIGGWVYCFEPVDTDALPGWTPSLPPSADLKMSILEKTYTKPGKAPSPGRGATFTGQDKPRGGDAWPMYGGCPERCGLEMEIGLPIEPAWKFDTGGEVHSSAAIKDGMVFVGSNSGKLFALDLAGGKKKWEYETGAWVHCSPAVGKGLVVFGADDGKLRAVDAGSGKERWSFQTDDWIRAAPVITGNTVVFGSWDRCIYSLTLNDGKQIWRYATGHKVHAAPAVYNGQVFGGGGDWILYALDLKNGKRVWHRLVGSILGITVYRNMAALLCQSGYNCKLRFLCPEDGTPAMRQENAGRRGAFGIPAFSGDRLFVGRWYRGGVGVVNLKEKRDSRYGFADSGCLETPLVSKEIMVSATINGTVSAYSISERKKLWEWKTPSGKMFHTAPVAAGGYIVAGNDDGFVYAFTYSK